MNGVTRALITFPAPTSDWGSVTFVMLFDDLRARFGGDTPKEIRRRRYVRRYMRRRGTWPIRRHCRRLTPPYDFGEASVELVKPDGMRVTLGTAKVEA